MPYVYQEHRYLKTQTKCYRHNGNTHSEWLDGIYRTVCLVQVFYLYIDGIYTTITIVKSVRFNIFEMLYLRNRKL